MTEIQIIERLIAENEFEGAITALNSNIEMEPDRAIWYQLRGMALWKKGDRSGAITQYEHAVALDAESPARAALELARNVMSFYNPDLLNP